MTSAYFPAPIDGKFCPDNPRRFTLDTDFIYQDEEKDIRVVIPAGFTTDFNSTPGAVWWYFSPWDVLEAGLVHDWLYAAPGAFGRLSKNGRFANTTVLTRQQCDDIHRRILHLKDMRLTKRNIIYGFLRSFGGVAWGRHRANDPPPSETL